MKLPGAQIPDLFTVASAVEVLVAGEQPDPPCLHKPRGRLGEVLSDFAALRPFVVSGVLAALVDRSTPSASEFTP